MLYTKKGDGGTSGDFSRTRRAKDHVLYEALGALDELNSLLGVCRRFVRQTRQKKAGKIDIPIPEILLEVQEALFVVQAELAGAPKTTAQEKVTALEGRIDALEALIPAPRGFIIPGSTDDSALLDYARAVSRRAERAVVRAKKTRPLAPASYAYLNRLSSLLYALARYAAAVAGVSEQSPSYQ